MSIHNKVTLAVAGAALAAVVAAGAALALFAQLTLEQRAQQALEPYARLVSVGSEAAVRFEDGQRAKEILDTLHANPHVLEAAIILGDGRLLASYRREGPEPVVASPLRPDGIFLNRDTAELTQSLAEGARLRLLANLEELNRQTRVLVLSLVAGLLVLFVFAALALRAALQRSIVRPIATLAKTVEQVGKRADYRQRVPSSGADELARLGQSFNAMMATVEERDTELRQLAVFQSALLGSASSGIISVLPDGTVSSFNPAAEDLLGYSADEVVGKVTPSVWHDVGEVARHARRLSAELGETVEPGFEAFSARPRRNLPEEGEWTFIRKDGTRFPALLSVAALRGEAGEITGFIGLVHDLTERKRAEESLRQSEERYRVLIQKLQVAVVVHAADRRIVTCNEVAQALLGQSEEQLMGRDASAPAWDFVREDGSAMPAEEFPVSQVLATRKPFRNRIVGVPRSGAERTIWALVNANPVFGPDGEITEIIVTFVDITERRRAQEKLAHLASIVESSDDAIVGKTLDETIVSWNRGAERIYGYAAEEIIGRSISVLVPPDLDGELQAIMEALRRGERVEHHQTTRLRKDGQRIHVALTISPIRNGSGKVVGASAIARDISERARAEAQIRQLNADLELRVAERTEQLVKANRELEAFAYSVSHDLRAPLRHVDGFIDLLAERSDGSLDEKCQRYMRAISEGAQRMGKLIDDLLSFSRMGRREMLAVEVDMNSLVREVIQTMEPDLKDREVRWELGDLPTVSGDRSMLRVVLQNLMANAVKFTSPREHAIIEIIGEKQGDEVVFQVKDNGVGFEPEYAHKLFGVFQRLHRDDEFEGTGIGLAHVRRVVERHGGRVWAEGAVDQGASFYFTIQLDEGVGAMKSIGGGERKG